MACRKQLLSLALAALCVYGAQAYAAEQPSVTLDRPGVGLRELKIGDVAPENYQRETASLKDWQARHLPAPDEHEQWVQIEDKYALINIPTGTIRQLVNKSSTGR